MTKVSPQFDIRDIYISKTNFNQNELVLLFYFFGKRSNGRQCQNSIMVTIGFKMTVE